MKPNENLSNCFSFWFEDFPRSDMKPIFITKLKVQIAPHHPPLHGSHTYFSGRLKKQVFVFQSETFL